MEKIKSIRFTITEDEVREVAKDIGVKSLLVEQVQSVLSMVEYDEMLAKDIRDSIRGSIEEVFDL